MFLSDLEFLASKGGMLSRGHQIMVPIDLDAEAVCWLLGPPPALKAVKKKELIDRGDWSHGEYDWCYYTIEEGRSMSEIQEFLWDAS